MGDWMSLYLADACALIDFYGERPSFPSDLRLLLEDEFSSVAIVATTVWEIAIKVRLGKLLDLREPSFPTLSDMLTAHGYTMLPFDHATAEQAGYLPPIHGDPFDRALIATAQRTGRIVLTSDRIFGRYGIPVRW
jgi:PIN domain nuclease of toxin-antitoxin system